MRNHSRVVAQISLSTGASASDVYSSFSPNHDAGHQSRKIPTFWWFDSTGTRKDSLHVTWTCLEPSYARHSATNCANLKRGSTQRALGTVISIRVAHVRILGTSVTHVRVPSLKQIAGLAQPDAGNVGHSLQLCAQRGWLAAEQLLRDQLGQVAPDPVIAVGVFAGGYACRRRHAHRSSGLCKRPRIRRRTLSRRACSASVIFVLRFSYSGPFLASLWLVFNGMSNLLGLCR